jgi:hypothetical protein
VWVWLATTSTFSNDLDIIVHLSPPLSFSTLFSAIDRHPQQLLWDVWDNYPPRRSLTVLGKIEGTQLREDIGMWCLLAIFFLKEINKRIFFVRNEGGIFFFLQWNT